MKIAILVLLFPPKWLAGTEIATYNIAKYLAKRGHEVHVITTLDDYLPKESMEEGFYVHRIRCPKVRYLGIILFWGKALLTLRKVNPDMIHAQSVKIGITGFLAKKLLKKPYIVWGRGTDVYLRWFIEKLISRSVLKNADAVISLTEDMKQEMQKIYNRQIFVIPNGVELRKFENLSKESARRKLHVEANEKIILFAGRLHFLKGVRYLIEAMDVVRNEVVKTRLILVGDGGERDYLEGIVKELNLEGYITFVGQVSHEEVPYYMIAADAFVLPSLSEGFPVVILEAMASGLSIIATRVGGLPEVVRDRENGFLVEPKNSQQIAEKILTLLKDDKEREKISSNNKRKAMEYSWDNITSMLEEIYQKLF